MTHETDAIVARIMTIRNGMISDADADTIVRREIDALCSFHFAPTPAEPVMCIGWPTIKRLAAGEAVWFESLGCGAVAADDLHGVDIDALLAKSPRERALERAALDFVHKVDRGEARSKRSYADFKAALAVSSTLGSSK